MIERSLTRSLALTRKLESENRAMGVLRGKLVFWFPLP